MMDIILADDQVEVREALRCALEDQADMHLVSEATSAVELLAHLALRCPDLVLLDWELPGMSGVELMAQAREVCPTLKLIALSVRPEACAQATRSGVECFVSKGDPPERLLDAVRRVASRKAI
ncbi:MAG: response regulator transcription factor [Chloroflexota bacterium]